MVHTAHGDVGVDRRTLPGLRASVDEAWRAYEAAERAWLDARARLQLASREEDRRRAVLERSP